MVALFAMTQLLLSAFPLSYSISQTGVTVEGVVADDTTRAPLAGTTIYAISEGEIATAQANIDGHFIFFDLRPGSYEFCGGRFGYANDCSPQRTVDLHAGFEYGLTVLLSRSLE